MNLVSPGWNRRFGKKKRRAALPLAPLFGALFIAGLTARPLAAQMPRGVFSLFGTGTPAANDRSDVCAPAAHRPASLDDSWGEDRSGQVFTRSRAAQMVVRRPLMRCQTIEMSASSQSVQFTDTTVGANTMRIYRAITPKQ